MITERSPIPKRQGKTPLFLAVTNPQKNIPKLTIDEREQQKKDGNVVSILLEHNADVKLTFDLKGAETKVRHPGNCEAVASF